jgi:CDP-glycerol glycerophosphotransferase (TagB/SpsB family)
VTGSPKFDELLEATRSWDRAALRAELGIAAGDRVLLVASRFRGIRETHQSIGSAFERLVRAADALERTHLLVKPHPAERGRPYAETIAALGVGRARVLPPGADLARLLFACDALVTVESLSAVEALVLARPVVILNMPTNLRAMVDAGVALGVALGEDPLPALRAALTDPAARQRLADARARYLDDVARGVDGRATGRILELLRDTLALSPAARGSGPKSPA